MIAVPMQVATQNKSIPVNIGSAYYMGRDAPYEGPLEFTPSGTEQIIHTAGKTVSDDITIHPIPSNYGLITYNGVFITVS